MSKGTIAAIVFAAVFTLALGIASLGFGWFMWALALNGFMGQQRAVETSMVVFFVLGIAALFVSGGLGSATVFFLSAKRGWHPAGSAALATGVFSVLIVVLHFVCLLVSVLVAEQMRTR